MKKHIVLTALVTFALTSVFWIACLIGAYMFWVNHQPDFLVTVDSPDRVFEGDVFELSATVENPTDGSLTLGSIDIYDSFIDGFEVVQVDPEPASMDPSFGFATFYFSQELPPGAIHTFVFKLRAVEAGVWTGDVDFCTPMENFVTATKTIVVESR